MIKLRPHADDKDLANAVAEYLFEHGQEAARNVVKYDPQGEQFYKMLISQLGGHYSQMSQLMNLTMNEQASTLGHEIIAKLMLCAWNLGTAAAVAPEVQQKLKEWHTAEMRKARADTPEEQALRAAIDAELNGRTVRQPKKEAIVIIDAVNARLRASNHPEVKIDVIRRRLEKLVRS